MVTGYWPIGMEIGKKKKTYIHYYTYIRGSMKENMPQSRSLMNLSRCLHCSTQWCNPTGSATAINP